MMRLKAIAISVILITVITGACGGTPTEQVAPTPPSLVISEVLAGVDGNNGYDFIELYNAGETPADLEGYSLWYQLSDDTEEMLIQAWDESVLVPPRGHYLLGQSGQDFGLALDAEFNQSLAPSRGGLVLRGPDDTVADQLAWGNGPANAAESAAITAMENGISLERQPGGEEGNGNDSDDNTADFKLNSFPNPQNSGSPAVPAFDENLVFTVEAPENSEPGSQYDYVLTVENQTESDLEGIVATLALPDELTVMDLPEQASAEDNVVSWAIGALESGQSTTATLTVRAPWTYTNLLVHSYYAEAENWPIAAFGGPLHISIEGGSIPIETARSLIGQEVVIEGVTTMYTGGFYAGSGVKFYVEDETGGLQVYISGAGGSLDVPLGVLVRVQGVVQPYRGSLELVPSSVEKVEIIDSATSENAVPPTLATIRQAANDMETLPGKLVQVEGTVARVEEFTYSYEIDMVDEEGQLLTLYVDKLTNITVEMIESGQRYRATGIIDVLDGQQRLNPRLQSDLVRIYPQVLLIEGDAASTVEAGGGYAATFTVFNHTDEPMTNLTVSAVIPTGAQVVTVNDDGNLTSGVVTWEIATLDGGGSSTSVSVELLAAGDGEYLAIEDYQATADQWLDPAVGEAVYTFIGERVPIWAIQGAGVRSPYLLDQVKTEGVVTGVFPGLEGFWIQEIESDDNPATSAGLFVYAEGLSLDVEIGDLVQVTGWVREAYQQTQLEIDNRLDVELISQNSALPAAVELDPPSDPATSLAYYEALEGMLVQVTGPAVAVAPMNRYGEISVVLPSHEVTRLWQGEDNGMMIMTDDGSSETHSDQSHLDYVASTGDQVSALIGPLAFTYGNYKIELLEAPVVEAEPIQLPNLGAIANNQFSVMTWNVENLFDFQDPHPSDPPLPTIGEYRLALTKVASTIVAAGAPTIVGLQEVENIEILEDLASHELLVNYNYQPVLIEGTDSRGIDVGYLVRGDQASILAQEQYPAPEGLTSRPPLLIEVQINNAGTPFTVYVINNHFTSMSGGEKATEPRRTAQAAWNVTVVEELLAEDPDAQVIVLGDLNSYYESLPIDTLRAAGLRHVFELLPEDQQYTYIYQGISQTLDHILATPSLFELAVRVEVLRVNADYPPPPVDDGSPMHKSDHDPVVVVFALPE